MTVRLNDLRFKEVISVSGGTRIGYIEDAEFDINDGRLTAVIVPGKPRIWGLFGRCEEHIVDWERIVKIGDDIVLTDYEPPLHVTFSDSGGFWKRLFK